MTQETSEQMYARWRREQEADAVAIRLGFAFKSEHRGACYWHGNGDAFRAGYEAGKAVPRSMEEPLAVADHGVTLGAAAAMQLSESRNQRVYVAGPMTGMPDYNFPAFNAAASMLRAKGWHVENPAEHGIVAGATWADYMHYDLARIATCSAIYLLPGWCQSRGAALEVHIASVLGMTFQYADGAERYHPPSATHPTQQGLADEGLYYLQDARWIGMVGNCPSFWRKGGGYTTNLDEAERFTLDAAMKQHKCRETDLPWLCSEVDKLRRPTVDCQYMPRSWDAQRAALTAQAKQGGA